MIGGDLRALIVDDDRAWQEILGEILHDMGLAVDLAAGYDAAVACLRTASYRLAIVDLSLSADTHQNRDGLRVLEAIRTYAPGCVPILLTGFATVELAVGAMTDYGAYTCLQKETFRRAPFRELLWRVLATPPTGRAGPSVSAVAPASVGTTALPPGAQRLALVVEDDAGWRSILAELLGDAGFRVAACVSYGEALGRLRREEIALAVVDLSLAAGYGGDNRDGYQVLESTHAAGIPALVVSGLAMSDDIQRAYDEYGVIAYVAKQTFDRRAFLQTVADACHLATLRSSSGATATDPTLLEQLARLTPREREVLDLLVQGLTNKGIAVTLTISVNTVKRYLKLIFDKLEVNSRAAAVAKAVSAGTRD